MDGEAKPNYKTLHVTALPISPEGGLLRHFLVGEISHPSHIGCDQLLSNFAPRYWLPARDQR